MIHGIIYHIDYNNIIVSGRGRLNNNNINNKKRKKYLYYYYCLLKCLQIKNYYIMIIYYVKYNY